ncbi:ubiquitin carboxyl-terminal hydrolase 5 isoform X2 [Bicyclus anynana]|uniref:Ubiquitin carboxyl-terminal hydrolase n=1 Tax=Bicyclus anynana TaxID=110368 RepID=A0A6J1NFK3_BICAN|nr:ubiquitin carboxyl-terminal hydrolase 5 isoform X2 [Bicyclus anynana]
MVLPNELKFLNFRQKYYLNKNNTIITEMASLDIMTPHLSKIKIPAPQQLIYKDECVYSFDNPESATGLYVSLTSFLGFGRNYVEQYFQKTGNAVFLHIHREKKPIPEPEQTGDGPEKKITRLAIGVEGGFDPDCGKPKFTYTDHYNVVVLPGFHTFPWPNDTLPEVVKKSVQGVLDAESPFKIAELEALQGTWDGEKREVSVHAVELKQLDNGVRIPPSGWKCAHCDLTTNLWLNLTDGAVLCGRKFFDGSGGNDHAVEHYRNTGYPLAVKLGTITAEGKGDVYSYAEDDMVEDPYLADHLQHFGINVKQLEKTDKSMVELELELNRRTGEWNTLQESGTELRPLHGPALTGMNNLGNSCYINSVIQVLFRMPDFVRRYVEGAPEIFSTFPDDPANDFDVQTAKLGVGLVSGRYSFPSSEGAQQGVSAHMYRRVVARGHAEFSTKRQQDAHEFYLHLLTLIERHSRHRANPADCLKFAVEDRIQCGESRGVRYTHRAEHHLPLPVPVGAATNAPQVRDYEARRAHAEAIGQRLDASHTVRPHIPFQACLDSFMKEDLVEQFFSSALNKKVTAHKTTRLATFPDYLLIQLKKFTIKEDWTPAKLDVAVEMPWEVDLSCLRGRGLQPDETLLPEATPETPPPVYNEALLSQLLDMGFPVEACKKSLYYTNNSGMEAASNWLMEHMADWDFANKFEPPGAQPAGAAASVPVDEASVEQIAGMGFTRAQAERALRSTAGDVGRALDWIFSHADQLEEQPAAPTQDRTLGCRDGPEKYKLVAFISHMGTSTMVGHYVCHILHEGRWVIFNDNKVALSENPPKDLGYLYLYERL